MVTCNRLIVKTEKWLGSKYGYFYSSPKSDQKRDNPPDEYLILNIRYQASSWLYVLFLLLLHATFFSNYWQSRNVWQKLYSDHIENCPLIVSIWFLRYTTTFILIIPCVTRGFIVTRNQLSNYQNNDTRGCFFEIGIFGPLEWIPPAFILEKIVKNIKCLNSQWMLKFVKSYADHQYSRASQIRKWIFGYQEWSTLGTPLLFWVSF